MRILNVITSANLEGGGPIEATLKQGEILTKLGHIVELATLDIPDDPVVSGCPFKVYALGPMRTSYAYSKRLLPWLRQNVSNYDCIIIHGLWQFHSFAVWRALRHSETPYFIFTHGMLDPWFKKTYPLKHLKKSLFWPWSDYRVLRDAKAVLFTCEDERLLARQSFKLYKCNERVISFGTSFPPEDVDAQVREFYRSFPQLTGKRYLLFLSRIHPKKGCDLLIKAFAQVASTVPDLHLVIAGPDRIGLQENLQKIADGGDVADRIVWTGMISNGVKYGAFYSAEAFVLPSHQENFGIAVAESLACGTPVLISNKVNIWREIQQDGAGIVAEDTLAGTVKLLENWLALSTDEKKLMGESSKQCFANRFEIHRAVESLIKVLQDNS